ncbi:MAG: hypothetical protein Q9166_004170 [cf. Caloplaca sp. 2 TL-2023]
MSGYKASIRTDLELPNKTALDATELNSLGDYLRYVEYFHTDLNSNTVDHNSINFYDSTLNASHHDSIAEPYHKSRPLFYTEDPQNFNCIAEKDRYGRGFPGEWVLIVSCLNGTWIAGIYVLWLHTEWKSSFTRRGRRMDAYRSIADVAEAMQEDLVETSVHIPRKGWTQPCSGEGL